MESKVVYPTYFPASGSTIKISESGKIWKLDNEKYKCEDVERQKSVKYPEYCENVKGSDGQSHGFIGGSMYFGTYGSSEAYEPMHVIVDMTKERFANILFSDSSKVSPFIRRLYEEVVHGSMNENDSEAIYGERYLYDNYEQIVDRLNSLANGHKFGEFTYQVNDDDEIIEDGGKFSSIGNLVESKGNVEQSLYGYAKAINEIVSEKSPDTSWLVNNMVKLFNKMHEQFSSTIYP